MVTVCKGIFVPEMIDADDATNTIIYYCMFIISYISW